MESPILLQHCNLHHYSVSQFILGRVLLPIPALPLIGHVTLESYSTSLALTFLISKGIKKKTKTKTLFCRPLHPVMWLLGDKAQGSVSAAQREV